MSSKDDTMSVVVSVHLFYHFSHIENDDCFLYVTGCITMCKLRNRAAKERLSV